MPARHAAHRHAVAEQGAGHVDGQHARHSGGFHIFHPRRRGDDAGAIDQSTQGIGTRPVCVQLGEQSGHGLVVGNIDRHGVRPGTEADTVGDHGAGRLGLHVVGEADVPP